MKRVAAIVSAIVSLVLVAGCTSASGRCEYIDGRWFCTGGAQGPVTPGPVATPGL